MSSLPNQPDVEDIISAFESAQNQSWSKFSDKMGGIPIKDCKKKDIFKSENPIELADEDIPVFGLVPRLEKFMLVSCNKCSMVVKSDCIHYHYKHRHNNSENDLFSVAQFIVPNVKTNKHKRPKLNIRKLSEKKIIDGVNIDPIVQGIKSEFDQVEFERISKLNREAEQENIIQYNNESTSVNLALHCTPGTSYFNEFCTQSLVQFPDQNEVNDQMTDYEEDVTKSVDIIKELQNNKCVEDTEDNISENIVHCITKVELNEQRKRRIDNTDCVNDDEELYDNSHPKKKYHFFSFKQNCQDSSLKTNNNCPDIIRNQNSNNAFTCYEEVNDKNLNKLLEYGKELKVINNKDDIGRDTINYTSKTTIHSSIIGTNELELNEERVVEVKFNDILSNRELANNNKSLLLQPRIKPQNVTNITSNKFSDVIKNQNSDNLVTFHNQLENFNKKADCDTNLNEILDEETNPKSNKCLNSVVRNKMVYNETCSKILPIKQLDSNRKIKCTTGSTDVINDDDKEYYKNQDSNNKYNYLPLNPHTYITSNSSSIMINKSVDNVASCDSKVNEKHTECNKDSNKFCNEGEKLQSNKCVNENIVNYFTISNEPLDKLSFNINKKITLKKKSKDLMDKNNKHLYENKPYSKNKYNYLPFEPSNGVSTIKYEENEYKIDETNGDSDVFYLPLPAKLINDEKPKTFIPISKFKKGMDGHYSCDPVSKFHKPSIVKNENYDVQLKKFSDVFKNINLSTPRTLESEKLEKCIPVNEYEKTIDDQGYGDSPTNVHKSPTVKHEGVKNEVDETPVNSKIEYLPLPLRSLNDNKSEKYIPICEDIKAINNQYSSDSIPAFKKSSSVKHEKVEDGMDKINVNSNIIYLPLPTTSLNDEKPKDYLPITDLVKAMINQCTSNDEQIEDEINENSKSRCLSLPLRSLIDHKLFIPISELIKTMDNCFSDPDHNLHESSSAELDNVENEEYEINVSSDIIYFPLSSNSSNNNKPKKFVPSSQLIKAIEDQHSYDYVTRSHKHSNAELKEIEDEIDKINFNSNESNKYILIKKFLKEMDDPFSNDSITIFSKLLTVSQNVKENILKSSNSIYPNNVSENDKSKIQFHQLPSTLMNSNSKMKYLPINNHSKALNSKNSDKIVFLKDHSKLSTSNIKEKTKLTQNKCTIVKDIQNPEVTDICYDHLSTNLQDFKNKSKSSLINNIVKEEYYDSSYNTYYQSPNYHTLSEVLKPILSVLKHFDSDIDTSSDQELCSKIHDILKNSKCSSKIQCYQLNKETIDVILDIISNEYYDDAFAKNFLTSSLFNKALKPFLLIIDLNDVYDNAIETYLKISTDLFNNQAIAKLTQIKHSDAMCSENSDSSTSSYDQSSIPSIGNKVKTKHSLKDIFSDMSDENYNNTKLHENLMKNNKCTQTVGSLNNINHWQFINPIITVDKSIEESHGTINVKTKCSQTDLLFGCLDTNETTNDFIDNYDPHNSDDKIIEDLMSSYTSDTSNNQSAEYAVNEYISTSSHTKSINNTIAPTSIEENEIMDNINSDHYLHRFQHSFRSTESHNDHISNCLTHHPVSDNNRQFESYDKTCSSRTDRAVHNGYHKANEMTLLVEKYFQIYKDHLNKISEGKCINVKNWKTIPHDNIEAKMRKKPKRRLEAKVVDDKENYGIWGPTGGYGRTFYFVERPALHQNHFSDESD